MPVSELPPPAGYRFNTGIGVLPQFRAGAPGLRPLPNDGPTVETPTSGSYPQPTQPSPDYYASSPAALPSSPFNSSGITPSAGGWNIDQYGNLVNSAVETGQNWGRSIGGFIGGDVGRYVPLPGAPQLGAFLGRQAGSLLGHGVGGLIGSIGNGLKNLFSGGGEGPNSTPPSDTPPGMGDSNTSPQYSSGPTQQQRDWGNVFNTGRFTNAPAFFTTLAQAQFPGSMIGPMGGGNQNPYNPNAPSVTGKSGSNKGLFGSTQAYQSYVAAHTQI